jgi:hypothetical protein
MVDIYKIATLGVNGMSSKMGMSMLDEFFHKQEIKILLLQEVTHIEFEMIRGTRCTLMLEYTTVEQQCSLESM